MAEPATTLMKLRRRIAFPEAGTTPRKETITAGIGDRRNGVRGVKLQGNNREPSMSALGHKRTSAHIRVMSALPPKADIAERDRHVCFVPKADITLSELGAIFAGDFVQLLLASLHWRYAGSRSYFAEKTFQPGRCNGPEQN